MHFPYECVHRSIKSLVGNVDFPLQCITPDYVNADFDSLADFTNASFFGIADFTDARFNATTRFILARFDSSATFQEAFFTQEANFTGTTFTNDVSFTSTEFKDLTIFLRTDFDSLAVFSGVAFDDYTSFEEARFSTQAAFNNTIFEGLITFQGAILPDSLDLRGLRTFEPLDLTQAQLDMLKSEDPTYRSLIALEDADISSIKLNMELFRLWFPGLDDQPGKKMAIYEEVLRKFKEDDLLDSYEVLDIEYRSFINQSGSRHVAHFINKYGWNYGYNKEWILWWALGGLVFLSFLGWVMRAKFS